MRQIFFKFKEKFQTNESTKQILEETSRVFGLIDPIHKFETLTPADAEAKKAWDLNLVVYFKSLPDIEDYKIHPEHRQYVDEFLQGKIEVIKAWNFEIETSS